MSTLIKTNTINRSMDLLLKENIPVHNFSTSALLEMEKSILDIYATAHPISLYRKKESSKSSGKFLLIRSHNLGQIRRGAPVLIAGLLVQVRRQFTRSRRIMAFLLLEDEIGFFEAIAFPKTFQSYSSLLAKDALLWIKGNTSNKSGEEKLIIQEIKNMDSSIGQNAL